METTEIVDSHQHLWDTEKFRLAWHRDFPLLDRRFAFNDYVRAVSSVENRARVVATVFMECDVEESQQVEEAHCIYEMARSQPQLQGAIAACRPENDGFQNHLDLLSHPLLKGVRRVLYAPPDETSQSALFRDNIRTLAARDLSFDMCVSSSQLPLAAELARACPDVQFVLDHCGNPNVAKGMGEEFETWRSNLQTLAREANVAVKVSGIVASASPGWNAETLRPFVETTVETFGASRAMWGGDWPVCLNRARLGDWIGAFLDIAANWSEAERRAVLSQTAQKIYRL